jgi:hypothetical protein
MTHPYDLCHKYISTDNAFSVFGSEQNSSLRQSKTSLVSTRRKNAHTSHDPVAAPPLLWAASHARRGDPGSAKRPGSRRATLAAANYKNARARCDAVTGNPKDVCVADAKAVRVRARKSARARYDDT